MNTQKLTKVTDCMATKLKSLKPETTIFDAISLLLKHEISGAPVVGSAGELVGVISEKDCLKALIDQAGDSQSKPLVSDYMTKDVTSVSSHVDIYWVAGLFLKSPYRRFPVVDQAGKLVGQISRRDVMRDIQRDMKKSGRLSPID